MKHPKDRSGLTRRQLLRGAAAAAVGVGAAGALAGCQNTTTPIGYCEDTGDGTVAGGAGGTTLSSNLVVAKPTGPGGLPLPRNDNSVEWAITDDNPKIPDGIKPEGGTLRIFNYADYIDPGSRQEVRKQFDCKVEIGTYNSSDEAVAKLTSGAGRLRRDHRPQRHAHRPAHGQAAPPAAQPHLPAQPREEHLAGAPGPVLRPGARTTRCPTSSGRTASAGATTRSTSTSPRWTSPGTSSGSRSRDKGKVGLLDDKRDALSMPMQRDAMRARHGRRRQHGGPEVVIAKAGDGSRAADGHLQHQGHDHGLPDAARGEERGSTSLVGRLSSQARSTTSPRARRRDVLSYWGPDSGGVVQNDFLCITKATDKPALAHAFLNFMLDEKNAYDNFVNYNGYMPPQKTITAERADRRAG